ncbi:MAG TPA: outer membrane beta-barrel protein [Ohtaekwangia sp.]
MRLSRVVLTIFFAAAISCLQAQDQCELTLGQAADEFNAGHFYDIPGLLKDCLNQRQKPEWRQRAYLLLAQTYLLLDDPEGAERSYLEVLRANPEYVTNDTQDPIDLVYLSSKFTASPVFSLFGKIGPNVSIIRQIVDRKAFVGSIDERYILRPGFQIAFGADWNYDDNLSVALEGNFVFSAYKLESKGVFDHDVVEFKDQQTWARIPLSVKYTDDQGKYRPYGYVGISADILLSDRATFLYTDGTLNQTDGVVKMDQQVEESPVLNLKSKRNTFNYSWFIGGGLKYKLGLQYAFIDLRYSFGMTNLVNTNNSIYEYGMGDRTSADFQGTGEPTMTWGHIDDYFRMDNLFLSVGYVYPLYKPRKLKKARSRSVLRSIKKQKHEVTGD